MEKKDKWKDLKDAINNLDKGDLYNWISDMMVFPEEWKAKNTKEEFIKEFCNDHNGQARWLRSVALDEDRLLTKILNWFDGYRSSQIVSEETRPTGEEELKNKIDDIVDDCIDWEESWDGEEESAHKSLDKPSFKDQIFNLIQEQLSLAREEGWKKGIELTKLKYQDAHLPTWYHLSDEELNKMDELEAEFNSLTNQSKENI